MDGWNGTDFHGSEKQRRRLGCYQAWVAAQIDSDGSLKLCDYGSDHGMPALGMAADYATSALRNGNAAVRIRESFSRKDDSLPHWCRTCSLYRNAASQSIAPSRAPGELWPATRLVPEQRAEAANPLRLDPTAAEDAQ